MPEPNNPVIPAPEAVRAIEQISIRGLDPRAVSDPNGYVLVPKDCTAVQLSKLWDEALLPNPRRTKRVTKVDDIASFALYWQKYAMENSLIFASADAATITGIIDADVPHGDAMWGSHRVELALVPSPEYVLWCGENGTAMKQDAFALFIEDNAPDILKPAPAAMVEMARTLEGTSESKFTGAVREKDGSHRMKFETVVDMRAGEKGELRIPDSFTLSIPIFAHGPRTAVEARLRYRVGPGGGCQMWYSLYRIEAAREKAFDEIVSAVRAETAAPVLLGVY